MSTLTPTHAFNPRLRGWIYLAFVLIALGVVTLATYRFRDRDYHRDEINTIHAAKILDAAGITRWMATNGVHPPGWRIAAAAWVNLTGVQEPITRYSSTLCTLIALALTFRLASDLFDRRTGLSAILILGTLRCVIFYVHEFRPYAILVLVTAGSLLTFLRWVRRPGFKYALLYVLFGVAALQTHYYGAMVIAAQAVMFVVLVRWDRGLYLRVFGLCAAVGLSLLSWMLPILNRLVDRGGISYGRPTNWDMVVHFYRVIQIVPESIGSLVLIVGLLMPVGIKVAWGHASQEAAERRFRFGAEWRKLYLALFGLALIVIVLISNLKAPSLTLRNLVVLTPALAILAAYGIRRMKWQVGLILMVLITYQALTHFRAYRTGAPYRASTAFFKVNFQPGDRIVQYYFTGEANLHYLLDRMPSYFTKQDIYIIALHRSNVPAEPTIWRAWSNTPDKVEDFKTFLGSAQRVWLLNSTDSSVSLFKPFLAALNEQYAAVRRIPIARTSYVVEYRRLPDDLRDQAHFGTAVSTSTDVSLQGWAIPAGVSVKVCQSVEIETWWQALRSPAGDYGIGLVLADAAGQGVVKNDAPPSSGSTSQWKPGTISLDVRTLTIPCDLPPGEYPLLIGMFDLKSTESLAAANPDGTPVGANLVYLTTLFVGK